MACDLESQSGTEALITGMSNQETADYLLRVGLKDFAGVAPPARVYGQLRSRTHCLLLRSGCLHCQVFFSMSGERLVLLREGWRVRFPRRF